MKSIYLRTDFPSGLTKILMRDADNPHYELYHYTLVLSNRGKLWVDVFWPYDEDAERCTHRISEQQFWQLFREWRLKGLILGDSGEVAEMLARRRLARNKRQQV